MQQKLIYKNEIRAAIIKNVKLNKNVFALRNILTISDIMLRAYDKELYKTVSEKEWHIRSIVSNAINCDEEYIGRLQAFTSAFVDKNAKKNRKRGGNNA